MKKRKWSTFFLLLTFFIGLSVLLYPAISNYWNSRTQTQALVDYESLLEKINKEDYTRYFEEAEAYNQKLASMTFPLVEGVNSNEYYQTLNIAGNGIMGSVNIDKIGVELPLYHGTSESVLAVAIGHLEGTSLPVGGESTHCVVSAHRGLASAKLFTDLDKLEKGDLFQVKVLDKTLTYEVDQIRIVKPNEVEELAIVKGEDYCTLLTCTPYGINTDRLLVRGTRIKTTEHKTIYVRTEAQRIDTLIVTPIVALPILFVLMMIVLFKPVKKDPLGDNL
ncbi:MAG: class C sortase [Clostridia bacterium]|nr:class C sortase [Clostridia bacterium]